MFSQPTRIKRLQFFVASLLVGVMMTFSISLSGVNPATAQTQTTQTAPATEAPVPEAAPAVPSSSATETPPVETSPADTSSEQESPVTRDRPAPTAPSTANQQPALPPAAQPANPSLIPKELTDKVADQVGPPPSAVVLQQQSLFEIPVGVGSFSPELRAQIISERLLTFAQTTEMPVSQLEVVDNLAAKTTDVKAGDEVILTVVEADAIAVGKPRVELANDYLSEIVPAVETYRTSYSLQSILLGALYTLLLTVFLIAIFTVINRTVDKQAYKLQNSTILPRGLRLFGTELIPAGMLANFLAELLKVARLIVLALVFAFYLERVLSFFPWTKGISNLVLAYLKIGLLSFGNRFFAYLPNLFFLGMTFVITSYLLKLIQFIFTEIRRGSVKIPGFYPEWSKPTYNLIRFAVIAFAVTIAYPYLPGSNTPAFKSISLFVGVLFSLGSSGAVANFVSGIILTYSRAFDVGDRVQISETTGDVIEKTLLVTRINTIKNVIVTIPNSMVLGSHIINYSGSVRHEGTPPLILNTTITLGYDVPWRLVHKVLIDAALSTEGVLGDPAPFVFQTSLDDFYVSYQINAYTQNPGSMARTYSALYQNLQDKCNEAGIEILSPHYAAARDGNQLTVPPDYVPKDYEAPGFRLSALTNMMSNLPNNNAQARQANDS